MKRKNLFLMITALLLVFALAACGGSDKATEAPAEKAPAATTETASQPEATKAQEAAPTEAPAEPTEAPTEAPAQPTEMPTEEPTPEPKEEMASEFVRIEDVVNSYHSKGEFGYEIKVEPADGSEPINMHMTFESDWVKADNKYGSNIATVITGINVPGVDGETSDQPGEFEMISVDDTTYLKLNDQWVSVPRDQTAEGEDETFSINIDDFITDMEGMKEVGTENINGIEAIHYTYQDEKVFGEMLDEIASSLMKEGEDVNQYDRGDVVAQGDIWIAKDGHYAVKAEFNMETSLTSKTKDKTISIKSHTLVEISNVNGDIKIEPPAEAPKPGEVNVPGFEPGTFPIPDQTTVQGSMAGLTTMVSQLSPEEVTAFYDEQLAKMGWTKAEGMMPSWAKGDNSFTLMITPNDDGTTTIIIMTTSQQ